MSKGFIWTAYGIDHKPLNGYMEIFAFNRKDATKRFRREYGNDSSIIYLVADTFSQWLVDKTDEEIELFYVNRVLPHDKRSITEIMEEAKI